MNVRSSDEMIFRRRDAAVIAPKIARLFDSVPPLVNTICRGSAPTIAATCARAASSVRRERWPARCTDEGFPAASCSRREIAAAASVRKRSARVMIEINWHGLFVRHSLRRLAYRTPERRKNVTQTVHQSANIIVIGAGVVGCSLAFHLARAGARVRVFDKGEICAGMSARSGALVRMHYTFAPEAELAWKSHRYFREWGEIVGGRCGFVETGFAVVVDERNAVATAYECRDAPARRRRYRSGDRDRVAEARAHAFVDDVALAAFEPHSGYADPVATTEALAAAAKRHGAEFSTNTAIAGIMHRGGRATGVVDGAGRIHEADAVCVVAGPWTDALLAPLGVKIGIRSERAQIAFFKRAASTQTLHLYRYDCRQLFSAAWRRSDDGRARRMEGRGRGESRRHSREQR